jgi:hypothetical protein
MARKSLRQKDMRLSGMAPGGSQKAPYIRPKTGMAPLLNHAVPRFNSDFRGLSNDAR